MSSPKWTILMVSYRSSLYLYWQLKILYEFNDPSQFNVVIVENKSFEEKSRIDAFAAPYKSKYNNIDVLFYKIKSKKREIPRIDEFGLIVLRDEHGETIDFVKTMVKTPYVLIHDPDFFFLQKNYLLILQKYLEQGNVAIGAPYLKKVGLGKPDFPAAFGCAFITDKIKNINFIGAHLDDKALDKASKIYPKKDGYGFSLDVGYRVRELLSKYPYISFEQHKDQDPYLNKIKKIFGKYGFSIPCYYYLGKINIGVHLFGGSRLCDDLTGYKYLDHNKQDILNRAFIRTRINVSKYYYKVIKNRNSKGNISNLYHFYLLFTAIFERAKTIFENAVIPLKLKSISKDSRQWTIGLASDKSDKYLEYQLRLLYELNNPDEFKVFIINSKDSDKRELSKIVKYYDNKYKNIEVINYSESKSNSLNTLLNKAKTPYLMINNTEFLWVQNNYLKKLGKYLSLGKVTVGASSNKMTRVGVTNFPDIIGCAFLTKALKNNNLQFVENKDHDFCYQIRERLSVEPILTFTEKKLKFDVQKSYSKTGNNFNSEKNCQNLLATKFTLEKQNIAYFFSEKKDIETMRLLPKKVKKIIKIN